jgi:hypothetical protein
MQAVFCRNIKIEEEDSSSFSVCGGLNEISEGPRIENEDSSSSQVSFKESKDLAKKK